MRPAANRGIWRPSDGDLALPGPSSAAGAADSPQPQISATPHYGQHAVKHFHQVIFTTNLGVEDKHFGANVLLKKAHLVLCWAQMLRDPWQLIPTAIHVTGWLGKGSQTRCLANSLHRLLNPYLPKSQQRWLSNFLKTWNSSSHQNNGS